MMKMIYLIAVVAAFAALSIRVTPHTNAVSTMTSERATDGAFRDGMYLGTLAAERGEAPRCIRALGDGSRPAVVYRGFRGIV